MIIETEKIRQALFTGMAKEAAERTGVPLRTVQKYRANKTASNYADWRGMSVRTAISIIEKLEEELKC